VATPPPTLKSEEHAHNQVSVECNQHPKQRYQGN
jgi:hypothetical protein